MRRPKRESAQRELGREADMVRGPNGTTWATSPHRDPRRAGSIGAVVGDVPERSDAETLRRVVSK